MRNYFITKFINFYIIIINHYNYKVTITTIVKKIKNFITQKGAYIFVNGAHSLSTACSVPSVPNTLLVGILSRGCSTTCGGGGVSSTAADVSSSTSAISSAPSSSPPPPSSCSISAAGTLTGVNSVSSSKVSIYGKH